MSLRLAQKYEAAWHKLYYELPRWKQECIIEQPHGRHAEELSREVSRCVEEPPQKTSTRTEED